jgi:heme/copper-type cytochrome/quinol oxidase subunit 2
VNQTIRNIGLALALASALATPSSALSTVAAANAGGPQDTVREIIIKSRKYSFSPARVEVGRGDILRITLIAEDVPHSFTIDEYRISKRVSPGNEVTFEFCANQRGRFVFYCNLSDDEGCRTMRGELIVR